MVTVENKDDVDYEAMAVWQAFVRRHKANFFDVFFYDREELNDKDFRGLLQQVSVFFQLPVPIVQDKCETIAKVMTSENASECELYYNWQLMIEAGVNNKDSLTLVVVHEMSHQYLYPVHFMLFDNELWIQELAADMLVGGYSTLGKDVATGKYKYVISKLPATLTHPEGELRTEMVEYGREFTRKLLKNRQYCGPKDILKSLPAFVYGHYSELKEMWDSVNLEDPVELPNIFGSNIDVKALPNNTYGTNLLMNYLNKTKGKKYENNGQ